MINVDVSAKHSRKGVVDDSVIKCDEIIETTKSNMTKTALAKSIPASFKLKQGDLKNEKFIYFTCLFIN